MFELVGGDFFDWILLNEKIFGVVLVDVVGYGLLVVLQVCDIYMGLCMGIGVDFKIVCMIECFNEIIYCSMLMSCFVVMFYGEFEVDGMFIFVNVGYYFLFYCKVDGIVWYFIEGGLIFGLILGVSYMCGYLMMCFGDVLFGVIDGLFECVCGQGDDCEEFGVECMEVVLCDYCRGMVEEIFDVVFDVMDVFVEGEVLMDDCIVVVIKYLEEQGLVFFVVFGLCGDEWVVLFVGVWIFRRLLCWQFCLVLLCSGMCFL